MESTLINRDFRWSPFDNSVRIIADIRIECFSEEELFFLMEMLKSINLQKAMDKNISPEKIKEAKIEEKTESLQEFSPINSLEL